MYGGYLIPELITDELLAQMNVEYTKVAKDGFVMGRRELEFMLACETTGRERYMALALLSAHYPVDLYSTDVDKRLEKVRCRLHFLRVKSTSIFRSRQSVPEYRFGSLMCLDAVDLCSQIIRKSSLSTLTLEKN